VRGPAGPEGCEPRPFRPLTEEQLRAAMPEASEKNVKTYLPYFNRVMQEAHIDTPQRQAAFLAEISAETRQLKWMSELAPKPSYGERFKGRGPLQLTGEANYKAAGRALGLDLVSDPDLVARDPSVGFRSAAWYWSQRDGGLNKHADKGDIDRINQLIVGVKEHASYPARRVAYERAKAALGAS
jgi:predicted chitinase